MCSGDEDDKEEPLDWLPIAPEIEDPEEAGWGHLEVSACIVVRGIHQVPNVTNTLSIAIKCIHKYRYQYIRTLHRVQL